VVRAIADAFVRGQRAGAPRSLLGRRLVEARAESEGADLINNSPSWGNRAAMGEPNR
jgi:hypothetical protein